MLPSGRIQRLLPPFVLLHYITKAVRKATAHNVEFIRIHAESFSEAVQSESLENQFKALNFSIATEAGTKGVTVTVHTWDWMLPAPPLEVATQ